MTVFNLTTELERLIEDIIRQVPQFAHIDTRRLLVCISSTRGGGVHGTYAKIHPLRFPGGSRTTTARRGRRTFICTMPEVRVRDREILYLIYFLAPRFFNLPLREKLITVFHELYHVSPAFDGDIRRFPGKNFAHGSSTKKYNLFMAQLVDEYLAGREEGELPLFLKQTMAELHSGHRVIVARRFKAPRMKVEPHT
jgi:hypothetical protein